MNSTHCLTGASPEAPQFLSNVISASEQSANVTHLGPLLYFLPHRRLAKARGRITRYIEQYIKTATEARSKIKPRGHVFSDVLLESGAPDDYVVDQPISILLAGRDAIASAMSAVFYCPARNPAPVRKLRDEVGETATESQTWEQLKRMQYLNCILKEGTMPLLLFKIYLPVLAIHRRWGKI